MATTFPRTRRGRGTSKSRRRTLPSSSSSSSSSTSKRRRRRAGRAGKASATAAAAGGEGGGKPAGRTDALHKVLQKQLRKRAGGKGKGENEDLEDICPHTQDPPEGYTLVPKGDVYITRNCRTQTHAAGQTVYTVYNTKLRKTLGLYIPTSIHTAVLSTATSTQTTRTAAVAAKDERDTARARTQLLTSFPFIPAADLDAVLNHAYMKGSRRVGRSGTVGDEGRKVELAVEAHVRHVHSGYEALLEKGVEREEARGRVREKVRDVKALWRGDG
ncbi:hypothetical protein AJ80_03253 [Polytolypa hystricis UAMH7299]|uniref:DUF2293 domain-containing protein n=1 Tax=Polytolypa hystricis (strain UAMH7299) TaxID=1447883 RepID=A0A2B7YKU1_POLH7|nr:hypothetical protein AJ80_03253 [Polytolypa hystricis UAMH7299]